MNHKLLKDRDFLDIPEIKIFESYSKRTSKQYFNLVNEIIHNSIYPSYVYTYPPRQTYREIEVLNNDEHIFNSILLSDQLNLYIHFPYCNQICKYCNLFTVKKTSDIDIQTFLEHIDIEAGYYSSNIKKIPSTVYIGGGSPSIMDIKHFEQLFEIINKNFASIDFDKIEVCVETDPFSVSNSKYKELRKMGINRVNLGVQTFNSQELSALGRKYSIDTMKKSISILKEIDYKNICVDLIYGLPDQSFENWIKSVNAVVNFKPETICVYPLQIRPKTGFGKLSNLVTAQEALYERYKVAAKILNSYGYQQETHIRFKLNDSGGYKQLDNHWDGQTILGIGPGARTYTPNLHFNNGYSSSNRKKILSDYYVSVQEKGHFRKQGIELSLEEQIRREFALNLRYFNKQKFRERYDVEFESCFTNLISGLEKLALIEDRLNEVKFTSDGFLYRDIISNLFFSNSISNLIKSYNYND